MKRVTHGKKGDDFSAMGCQLKDRRKAYYHGKYNREIFSMLLLLVFIGILIIH
ncbi:MAG: hypothetical protein ACJA13_001681 [Paraglaciecola sp.]|jgi:hypothetical protein